MRCLSPHRSEPSMSSPGSGSGICRSPGNSCPACRGGSVAATGRAPAAVIDSQHASRKVRPSGSRAKAFGPPNRRPSPPARISPANRTELLERPDSSTTVQGYRIGMVGARRPIVEAGQCQGAGRYFDVGFRRGPRWRPGPSLDWQTNERAIRPASLPKDPLSRGGGCTAVYRTMRRVLAARRSGKQFGDPPGGPVGS
jgi:hypothetical protein